MANEASPQEAVDEWKQARLNAATLLARHFGEPPPSLETVLRDDARINIRSCQERFAKSGNSMNIMEAFCSARSVGDQFPEWVVDYIYGAFSYVLSMRGAYEMGLLQGRKIKNNPVQALAVAFGFNQGKGKETVWDELLLKPNDPELFGELVVSLAQMVSGQGKIFNISGLIAEVRERKPFGESVSNSSAWIAWHAYKKLHPEQVTAMERLPGYRIRKQRSRTHRK